MRIVVLDTETTGMKETDQVLELALVSWRHQNSPREKDDRWSSLVRPTCPVSTGARAVHHVSDEELARAPTMEELLDRRGLPEFGLLGRGQVHDSYTEEAVCVAAHNLAFDSRMLRQSARADVLPPLRICTYRCAMHLYPDSEDGHSNQVLRYHLGLKVPEVTNLPPHRALPDALVTAEVLKHMLRTHSPEELVALSTTPARLRTVRFGKYRGTLWKDVPSDYLEFILKKDFDEDVKLTASAVLEGRRRPLLQPKTGA
jgi:exodeoxyribonuclease X